jgi:hypothetical protein
MKLGDSTKSWRARFFLTRPASAADFKAGLEVLAFEGETDEYGAYKAPNNRDHARQGAWFNCKIGDMSDGHKGYIVCGSWKVQTKNIRVLRLSRDAVAVLPHVRYPPRPPTAPLSAGSHDGSLPLRHSADGARHRAPIRPRRAQSRRRQDRQDG